MIKIQLTRDDAFKILELGKQLHQESRFSSEPFSADKCWGVLDGTLRYPDKFFIAYDDQFHGFILMHMGTEFFNDVKRASDLSVYIQPEFRGTSLFVKLIKSAEKWAKENGAVDLTINHNTGIDIEKATSSFVKLGYSEKGRIFSKEL